MSKSIGAVHHTRDSEGIYFGIGLLTILLASSSFCRFSYGANIYEWLTIGAVNLFYARKFSGRIKECCRYKRIVLIAPVFLITYSLLVSTDINLSMLALIKSISVLAASVLFCFSSHLSIPQRILILSAVFTCGTALSFFSDLAWSTGQSYSNMTTPLFRGLSGHENLLALELGAVILLLNFVQHLNPSKFERTVVVFLTFLSLTLYLFTDGTTSQIALIVSIIYIINFRRQTLTRVIEYGALILVILTPPLLSKGIALKYHPMTSTFTGRSILWRDVIDTVVSHPWGIGWWNYAKSFTDWRVHTHNDLLEILVASGLIGAVLVVAIAIGLLRLLRESSGRIERSALGSLVIYILLVGITEIPLGSAGFGLIIFNIVALMSIRLNQQSERLVNQR